tara:strand:+ start:114 stop:299 length:186 start_codon:yes stop_codon:yes gene_type:complete
MYTNIFEKDLQELVKELKAKNKELERKYALLVKILNTGTVKLTNIEKNFQEDMINEMDSQY